MAQGKFSLITSLILEKAGFTTNLQKASKEAKQFEQGINAASNSIKESFGALGSQVMPAFAGSFSGLGGVLKNVKTAFLALVPACETVSAALISTGIGALVVAIGVAVAGLIAWLKRTDEGGDFMRKVMLEIGAVIQVLLQKLTNLGTAIVKLFKGDFKGAAEEAKKAFTGWGDAIQDNINKAKELNEVKDKLEDFDETFAKRKATIEEQITALQEKATNMQENTAKERLAAAEELKKKEAELYNIKLAKGQMELAALRKEVEIHGTNQELRQKINEKEAELIGLRSEYNQGLRASNKLINKNIDDAAKEVAREKWQADYAANPMTAMQGKSGGVSLFNDKGKAISANESSPMVIAKNQTKSYIDTLLELKNTYRDVYDKQVEFWDKLKVDAKEGAEWVGVFAGAFTGLGEAMSAMISGQKGAFKSFVGEILAGIRKILLAKLAEAIISLFAGESSKGIVGLALAAGGAVVLSGLYAKWAGSFAQGGIIGGGSFMGDKLQANVNSGEMILNRSQQSRLFAIANGGSAGGGQVTFRIQGTELVGVLANNGKKYNRFI